MYTEDRLYIIDVTSPFFVHHPGGHINWSKIPYSSLDRYFSAHSGDRRELELDIERYFATVSRIGYNAVSMDELSRLVSFDFYPPELKRKISLYRKCYRLFFRHAIRHGLRIFVTTDFMFYNRDIDVEIGRSPEGAMDLMRRALVRLFEDYPEVNGVIFRIGECDGVDVEGDFRSRLVLKNAAMVNDFISGTLPIFEERDRLMIMRTWTMGATRAGDLIWNSGTFDRAFRDVESENFIVSMKYGDHDFFRYLELNPHFFRGSMKKIIELQTRREYEGFGEYPSFVGWEYRRFYERLSREPSFCGIHVWCQTGGWSDFRNFTFMKNSSYWNELNTVVTLRIFRYGLTVEEAVISFAGHDDIEKYMEFLRLADEAVMKLLYLPEFASQRLFFNRVRIPPLLHVSWNNVTVTDHLITFYRAFIDDREEIVRSGYEALACVRRMGPMAGELGIPYNHDFHYDTFELLALCLDLMMSDDPRDLLERIRPLLENYERNYPERYRFYINVSGMRRSPVMRLLLFVSARKRPAYRLIDRFLFNRIMARMYLLAFFLMRNRLPGFVNRQGMAVSSIFL